MEGFRELHNNMIPKKHNSQNNTPLNIIPLTHISYGLYIECPPRGKQRSKHCIAMELIYSNWTSDLDRSKVALNMRLHHEMGAKKLITLTKLVIWIGIRWH
jgi:hypothetical protein